MTPEEMGTGRAIGYCIIAFCLLMLVLDWCLQLKGRWPHARKKDKSPHSARSSTPARHGDSISLPQGYSPGDLLPTSDTRVVKISWWRRRFVAGRLAGLKLQREFCRYQMYRYAGKVSNLNREIKGITNGN